MMTRDEAEAAARNGAKVRCNNWDKNHWVAFVDGKLLDRHGDDLVGSFSDYGKPVGWSIVEPAPTPPPNIGEHDSIMAMLQEREDRAAFRTSRKPDAPGVMSDDEIRRDIMTRPIMSIDFAIYEAIRLTRQSVREQLAANEERAVKAGLLGQVYDNPDDAAAVESCIRAALAAIREGL